MKGIILLPRFWKSVSKLETFIFSGKWVLVGGHPWDYFVPNSGTTTRIYAYFKFIMRNTTH